MKEINRVAIAVQPKEPFYEWIQSIEPDAPIESLSDSDARTIYLVTPGDADDEEVVLQENFGVIFEAELQAWYTDNRVWPTPRTYAMFRVWFDARLVGTVFDLER